MAFLVNRSVMEERDGSHLGLMKWDGVCVRGWGAAQGNIQFACNALSMTKKKSFISGDVGMLNEGLLILRTEIFSFTKGAVVCVCVGGGMRVNTDSTHHTTSLRMHRIYQMLKWCYGSSRSGACLWEIKEKWITGNQQHS